MPYLLEFCQNERRNIVGTFDLEENVLRFIESIPFVDKVTDKYGTTYSIKFKAIPDLYLVEYNNWCYPLSRTSYSEYESDGDIYIAITKIGDLDSTTKDAMTYVEGYSIVDTYYLENKEIPAEINKRKSFYNAVKQYYETFGRKVVCEGLGSQDGEYILVETAPNSNEMHLTFLFDSNTIESWEKAESFAQWVKEYLKE